MKLIAITSLEVATRLQEAYPTYVIIRSDGQGNYYVYLKKEYTYESKD